MASRRDIQAGRAYVELFVKDSRFYKGLQRAQQRTMKFGQDMLGAGRTLGMAAGAMLAPFALGARTFANFDDAMRQVKAVTKANETEFASLTEKAKELGRTTSFTAIQVGGLMTELGRANFSPAEIEQMTGAVLDLSRATGTDAVEASGIMSAALRQFGLGAADATRVADALTVTANGSFNTVTQLGEAMTYAGPVAKDFNMSIEDTLAVMGGLGNMGIQASSAGTAMRRILLATGADAKKLNKIFGVEFKDAAGNAKPLVQVLGEVNEATKDLGTAERAKKFKDAFGLLGITAASSVGRSVGDIEALRQKIEDLPGAASDAAKEMDKGLGGAFRIFMSAFEGVQIALGDAISEGLGGFVRAATSALGVVTQFIDENQELVSSFAKGVLVVGGVAAALLGIGFAASALSVAFGGIAAVVGAAASSFTLLATVVGGLLGILTMPFTVAAVAIASVGVLVVNLTGSMEMLVAKVMGVGQWFSDVFGNIRRVVAETVGGVKDALMSGDFELAGEIAMAGLELVIRQGMAAIGSAIGGKWAETIGTITNQLASGEFTEAFGTVVTGLGKIWAEFSAGLVNMFRGAVESVTGLWDSAVKGITDKIFALPGPIFRVVTGVSKDVLKEQERLEQARQRSLAKLREEEGVVMGSGVAGLGSDIFKQIEDGTFQGSAMAAVDGAVSNALDALGRQADQNIQAADAALAQAVSGGAADADEQITLLQKKLDGLRMKSKVEAAKAESEAAKREAERQAEAEKAAGASGSASGDFAGAGGTVATNSTQLAALQSGAGTAMGAVKEGAEMTVAAVHKVEEKMVEVIHATTLVSNAVKDNALHHP